jgi:hypothetical protein
LEKIQIFKTWNNGKLYLPTKAQLKPRLEVHLNNIVQTRKYPYQDKVWAENINNKFAELPEDFKPEKKLTDDAQTLLFFLFSMELDSFKAKVPLSRFDEEMNLPLFIILGSSQKAAIDAKEADIGIYRVLGSIFSWWTTIWPFCR